jgi:hypothetical protein
MNVCWGQLNMEYNIFYSWQSDLDDYFQTDQVRFIENALNQAKSSLDENHTYRIDKATRDVAGAINIIETIDLKIRQCDIFIADISIINKGSKFRKNPNPNVMFELGLAKELVGWNNIILVLNDYFGKYNDLPFDIKTRRAINFTLSKGQRSNKVAISQLVDNLSTAIKACLNKVPKLRLKEILNALNDSEWEAYNFTNGQIDQSEKKGRVTISQINNHIYSFDFDSYENNIRFKNGDWKARFFVNETTLTTADLVFRSGIDFGFKRIMFPLDRNYDELFLIGTPPVYGNQILKRKRALKNT